MLKNIFFILILTISSVLSAQKQDTIRPVVKRQWILSSDYSEEITQPVDTTYTLFHRHKITDKYSPFNAYPGNYGLPTYQINFFDRISNPDMYLYDYYYPFMHLPDNAVFMNTQTPFTEVDFTYAGPSDRSDQTFRVRHSQNVNRLLNFGLIYDIVYCLGQYNYQRSENKTFTLYSSYSGVKYKFYIAGGINNITSVENGGLKNISLMSSNIDTRDLEVNLGALNKAESILKNRNLLIVQKYSVNKKSSLVADTSKTSPIHRKFRMEGTFSHILEIEINKKSYSDSYPKSGFYDTTYISNTLTFDSLSTRSIKNTIRFDFSTDETRKFRLGGGVGIRNEIFRYSQILPTYSVPVSDTAVWRNSNNVLIGKLYNDIGEKFRWIANGELFFSGYRAGDFMLDGNLIKSFDFKKGRADLDLFGKITNTQPSIWYDRWGSNNFIWQNNFLKEFRINVGGEINYPARRTTIKFNYAIIKNYTDFGLDTLPSQYKSGLSVAALYIKKEFSIWKFHLANDLLIQKSSNKTVLDLPLFTDRTACFFEHNIHFKLTNGYLITQVGVEVFYNTAYYGYSYMPATGRFFRQNQTLTGDYPYVNAFLNIKLKRTRIFLMFDHINYSFNGYNYFMVPSNPMNIRMFKYGLAWTFYD
jgi:Putative porin